MRVELDRDQVPEAAAQPVCGFTQEDYAQFLADLLPRGWAWSRDPDSVLMRTWAGLAAEYWRLNNRDCDLLREAYPGTALETLTDWERICGLPDPCIGQPPTIQQRRNVVLAKLAARGGQSRAYYIAVARALGIPITITEYTTFRVGQNRAGDPICGVDWAYTWRINALDDVMGYFRVSLSTAGEALRYWGNKLLECVMDQIKPAHTILLFGYRFEFSSWDDGESIWDDGESRWDVPRDFAD